LTRGSYWIILQFKEEIMNQNINKSTPYDTGKVKIGLFYEQPKQSLSRDDMYLQDMLLGAGDELLPPRSFPWFDVVVYIAAALALAVLIF